MALWTCEKCGEVTRTAARAAHRKYRCPKQGNLLKAAQAVDASEGPKCWCGCGGLLDVRTSQKPKRFMNTEHYERWRAKERAKRGTTEQEETRAEEIAAERLVEEMKPVRAREAEVIDAVRAVPLLTPDANFRLWMQCLSIPA
jgi:rRNA maturation protein Nop10